MPNAVKTMVAKPITGVNIDESVYEEVVARSVCEKKPRLTRSPRTVRIAIEGSKAKRLNLNGGAEYKVRRMAEPTRTMERAGVVAGAEQKARPDKSDNLMTNQPSV